MTSISDLSRVESFLASRGLKVNRSLKDGNDFYRAVSHRLYGIDEHPKSARKEICDFEKEKEFHYFQLFLPHKINTETVNDRTMRELFLEDVKEKRQNKEPPSERELYACAERLKTDIYIFSQHEEGSEDSQWGWFLFAPIFTDQDDASGNPLMLLRFQMENGKHDFARIDKISNQDLPNTQDYDLSSSERLPDFLCQDKFPHSRCYTFRFSTESVWFRNMHNTCIQHCQSVGEVSSRDTSKWDREFLENDHSFFRCLSKELYDTDEYFNLIRGAVCDFELHDDYTDVFTQFINTPEADTEKVRRQKFQENVTKIRSGTQQPGKGDIFACASLLHVPIFVYNFSGKWEMYPPLTSSIDGTLSYVSLLESAEHRYERLVPRNSHCNCQVVQPRITGNVRNLKQDLSGVILGIVGKEQPCCVRMRHTRHAHLDHVAIKMGKHNAVKYTDERYKYIFPGETTATVITLLEEEGRTLNQISEGGGLLTDCLCKEIFGDEVHCNAVKDAFQGALTASVSAKYDCTHLEDISLEGVSDLTDTTSDIDEIDVQIQQASNWIGVPVYMFVEIGTTKSKKFKWKRFIPLEDQKKTNCRYYVTIYYNKEEKLFDRVVPVKGCNCQLLPPVSVFQDESQDVLSGNRLQSIDDPHRPMVEFLLEKLPDDLFSNEERNISVSHVYTDTYLLMLRPDMSNRAIDQVELDSHSFYRCISKEIFGTENNFTLIREKICDEMRNNAEVLKDILFGQIQNNNKPMSRKEKADELAKRIKKIQNDYEADDLEILVTATFFQTPIYVLCLEVDGRTHWKEYLQLNRKPKPQTTPERLSTCRSLGRADKFCVTLIQTSAGHFDRIVPSSEICNCLIDMPNVPENEHFTYPQMTENEIHSLVLMREVESCLSKLNIALNNWTMTNQLMQLLCEKVVDELEGNRRKVNFATIAGSATGMVGAVLAIAGLIAGPVTFGASLGLTIAGGVVGGVGGVTTISSKITEAVLVKKTLAQLTFCRHNFEERSSALKESVQMLHTKIKDLDDQANSFIHKSDVEAFDKSLFQSVGAVLRAAKEFYIIPLAMLRFSIRGATVASAVLGPLTIVLDVGFMAYSIWNLSKGSRTDVSENLRRISSILQASRIQMLTWANGNINR